MSLPTVEPWLVEILRCPSCGGTVQPVPDAQTIHGLRCAAESLTYPVREGIPVMLIDDAIADHDAAPAPGGSAPVPDDDAKS